MVIGWEDIYFVWDIVLGLVLVFEFLNVVYLVH